MNIGLFGGSFDPPHLGHLLLAEQACETLALDKLIFIPAYHSPFKSSDQATSIETRCELTQLAINDNPRFELSIFEAERKETSFTIDTLRHFKSEYPSDTLYLMVGADAFAAFKDWKEPDEIVKLAKLAIALRPDSPQDISGLPYAEHTTILAMPLIDISSTDIRQRVKEGRSILYHVPWQVKTFIDYMGLYK
jgi:nicotinate-nucleotide adenylyltransferase